MSKRLIQIFLTSQNIDVAKVRARLKINKNSRAIDYE